jgi:hypothetical protein
VVEVADRLVAMFEVDAERWDEADQEHDLALTDDLVTLLD